MRTIKHHAIAVAVAYIFANSPASAWDFVYGYQNVYDANADTYLVGQQNVRKYSEWQSPPATYWGPSANDAQGLLTYHFAFSAATAAITLKAETIAFNFPSRGDYGSSSLWGSKDGVSWQLLQDNPVPASSGPAVSSDLFFNQALGSSLLGGNSFWLQVRLQEHNANPDGQPPNTSYADAQFSRYEQMPGNLFELDATLVPEPGSASILGLGLVGLTIFRHRKRSG